MFGFYAITEQEEKKTIIQENDLTKYDNWEKSI